MTAGSTGALSRRSHPESESSWMLAIVLAGAGGSGLAALVTLVSGGGLLAACLVYVVGASFAVPVLAAAPHARRAVARARVVAPRLARQPS